MTKENTKTADKEQSGPSNLDVAELLQKINDMLSLEDEMSSMAPMVRLNRVISGLRVGKGRRNQFAKFDYRNVEDILSAVNPLLAPEDIFISISDELVELANRIYVMAVATAYDAITGQEITKSKAFAREQETKKGMDESQITGTASSYARKNALGALLRISDGKDDPDGTSGSEPAENKEIKPEVNKSGSAALERVF